MGAKEQGTDSAATSGRWQVIPRTLCFVTYGDELLLMKRGLHKKIFPGHYNGLGGHIERGEDPMQSAIREIKEESGLDVVNVRYRGTTHVDAGGDVGIMLFIFTAEATTKHSIASEEGELEWLHLPTLLDGIAANNYEWKLVEDLPILLPHLYGATHDAGPLFATVGYDDADQIQFIVSAHQ